MFKVLVGAGALVFGVCMILTARRASESRGERKFLGYRSYGVANLRLVGAGFCLLGAFALMTGFGVWD